MRTPPSPVIGSAVLTFGSLAYAAVRMITAYNQASALYGPQGAAFYGRWVIMMTGFFLLFVALPSLLTLVGSRIARVVLSAVMGLGLAVSLFVLLSTGAVQPFIDSAPMTAIELAAVVLLYTRQANAFFKREPIAAPNHTPTPSPKPLATVGDHPCERHRCP